MRFKEGDAMILSEVFDRFAKQAPVSVMMRATLENVLSPERLDRIFEKHSREQYVNELLFSTVADIMGEVVCRVQPSVNAAYKARSEEIQVTIKAVYDKLKGIEPRVSRALVRETAEHTRTILEKVHPDAEPLVQGYRVKILDGNHLRRTDRRIEELRKRNVAPLPGLALVVYDPQYRLVIDAVPCEDGHAQERSLIHDLYPTIDPSDLWIADRNFCTISFLTTLDSKSAKFVIRQHANVPFTPRGKQKRIGTIATGTVYEQVITIPIGKDQVRTLRRVTVRLNEATRDGDQEIHLMTNLPKRTSALRVAELYRDRWRIETAFQEMAKNLQGEIQALGYPKAALFGFCMALVSYNLLSTVNIAVRTVHGDEAANQLSTYYVALEVNGTAKGMSVVLDDDFWQRTFAHLSPLQMARQLKRLAANMNMDRYRKATWKPKNKSQPKMNKKHRGHASTARILAEAREMRKATP
jgi:hypothetical protein